MNKKHLYLILIFLMLLALQPDAAAQCAMCKASVESSMNGPNSVGRSLNSGILYLMAVPYLLIAFIFRKQLYKLGKDLLGKRKRA